jgi:hypothetical protein
MGHMMLIQGIRTFARDANKPMPAFKVKGNNIGNFIVPGTIMRSIERNGFPVLQLSKIKESSSKELILTQLKYSRCFGKSPVQK